MKTAQNQILSAPMYEVFASELEPGDVLEATDLLPSPDPIQGWVPMYGFLVGQTIPPGGFGTLFVRPV